MKSLFYFLVGFMAVCLVIVWAFTAGATCSPGTYFGLGNGGAIPSATNWIPPKAFPGSFSGDFGYYYQFQGKSSVGNCANPDYCNQWRKTGGGTVDTWRDCFADGCSGGQRRWQDFNYGNTYYSLVDYGTDKDWDCDGTMDNTDQSYSPGGAEKFRRKYAYTKKSNGVVYALYDGDLGNEMWTSSDGSSVPSSFPPSDYTVTLDMWSGEGGYKSVSDLVLAAGSGIFPGNSGQGTNIGSMGGGETAGSTSPGKGSGGDSGSASGSGTTSDWTTMFDYLQGIQRNTKATADNLVNVEGDLEKIKQNQTIGAGIGNPGNPLQVDPRPNIDAVKGSVDESTTKLGEIKDAMVPLGEEAFPDAAAGDVAQVQDQSEISEENNTAKENMEKGIMTSFLDGWWSSNPIRSIVENSGVSASGSASFTISTATIGSTTVDLSALGDGLSTAGTLLVSIAGLGGILVVLRS